VRILYVCHRFPYPPKRGGKIRPFNMIRHFGEQGHEVTVASLVRTDEEEMEGAGLREHCARVLSARVDANMARLRMVSRLASTVPSSMGYFYSPRLASQINEVLARERFDLVFVHCSSVAQYVAGRTDVARILDFGDMDSQKWLEYSRSHGFPMALGYWLEGSKLAREERRLATRFDLCTCTTRAELATLDGYGTGAVSGWFPNGVDSEFFQPAPDEQVDPQRICFVGRMDYYPNQQAMFRFCEAVWPSLHAQRPALELQIVGADPSPAVRRLGEIPGVTVTGSVPDVRPYVSRAAVSIAPLQIARGTQNKILESMAMGVPVVCSEVASGGVDAVPGEHLLVADSPQEFAAALGSLLDSPARRAALGAAARNRVLSHHSWASSMVRLDRLVEQTLERRAAAP
jgi:sugar transferase (PEP-CTERM/EpsH1 system associated)